MLWKDDSLSMKAARYICANAAVKEHLNLTVDRFSEWANEELLLNETLEPGFPRRIHRETARLWMHKMGFEVLSHKKGTFV